MLVLVIYSSKMTGPFPNGVSSKAQGWKRGVSKVMISVLHIWAVVLRLGKRSWYALYTQCCQLREGTKTRLHPPFRDHTTPKQSKTKPSECGAHPGQGVSVEIDARFTLAKGTGL